MFEPQTQPAGDGTVTAAASLVRSPAEFDNMQPDTVLVCTTTTPAWTPLFSEASGLVTDIGGALAHGSIVAREYGIPAVMGTGVATQHIASGQGIGVDGDAGRVTLQDDASTLEPAAELRAAREGPGRRRAVVAGAVAIAGLIVWRSLRNRRLIRAL